MNTFYIVFIFSKEYEDINIIGLFDNYKDAKKCFNKCFIKILDENLLNNNINFTIISEDLIFLNESEYIEIRKIKNTNNCRLKIEEIDNIKW